MKEKIISLIKELGDSSYRQNLLDAFNNYEAVISKEKDALITSLSILQDRITLLGKENALLHNESSRFSSRISELKQQLQESEYVKLEQLRNTHENQLVVRDALKKQIEDLKEQLRQCQQQRDDLQKLLDNSTTTSTNKERDLS